MFLSPGLFQGAVLQRVYTGQFTLMKGCSHVSLGVEKKSRGNNVLFYAPQPNLPLQIRSHVNLFRALWRNEKFFALNFFPSSFFPGISKSSPLCGIHGVAVNFYPASDLSSLQVAKPFLPSLWRKLQPGLTNWLAGRYRYHFLSHENWRIHSTWNSLH